MEEIEERVFSYVDFLLKYIRLHKTLVYFSILALVSLVMIIGIININNKSKVKVMTYSTEQTGSANTSTSTLSHIQQKQDPPIENEKQQNSIIDFFASIFSSQQKNANGKSIPAAKNTQTKTGGESQKPADQTTAKNETQNAKGNSGAGSNNSQTSGTSQSPGGSSGSSESPGGSGSTPPTPSPTPVTDVQIVFQNPNGGFETYVPPAIAPIAVEWSRYTNYQDHYAIDIPANWRMVKSTYNGHEGLTFYLPNVDPNTVDMESIAFVGWQLDYLGSSSRHTVQIIVDNVPGTLYTSGKMGKSPIAAVFQYSYGYFAIGSSASDAVFAYVYDHMLRSISFNVQ